MTKIYSLGAFLTRTFAKRWWHQRLMGRTWKKKTGLKMFTHQCWTWGRRRRVQDCGARPQWVRASWSASTASGWILPFCNHERERANTHRRSIKLHGTVSFICQREKNSSTHTARCTQKFPRAARLIYIFTQRHKQREGLWWLCESGASCGRHRKLKFAFTKEWLGDCRFNRLTITHHPLIATPLSHHAYINI